MTKETGILFENMETRSYKRFYIVVIGSRDFNVLLESGAKSPVLKVK